MDPRSLASGFRKSLRFLNDEGFEYLVIGGHAVAYHGCPRATNHLDVWVSVPGANATRLATALRKFGFDMPEVTPSLFI